MLRALVLLVAIASCAKQADKRQLDHDLIRVTSDAKLRTDTIGDGKFTDLATFVLVEAENTAPEGAYVTLAGELTNEAGTLVGELRPQSLWIPSGELRTFALIDMKRKARPDAKAAKIYVRGAHKGQPPQAHIDGFRQVDDVDKVVVQGTLVNDAKRPGNVMVLATFYDANNKPMTRPFSLLWIDKQAQLPLQFAGPVGSKRGMIFIGDTAY